VRILQVFQPVDGGVFRHVAELADGMGARGHEVWACGTRAVPGVADERFAPLALERAIRPEPDARALAAFARVLRRVRPQVVHLHSSKAGALGRLARWAAPRTPVVYSPHGYAFNGHFERERDRQLYRGVETLLSPLATRVLCVCEAERRLAASVGPTSRTRIVHNGVAAAAPGALHPAIVGAKERGPVVVAVTPLRSGKGVETLIDAWPAVLAWHPRATLAIAGDGSEERQLRERASAAGLDDAVRFLGFADEPLSVIAGGDVAVHPSWAESFPYGVLEAMTTGVALVATDVGGTAEAVEDGRSGLLVPPRDAAALADAISGLLADRDRARSLGEAAQARVRERFTLGHMVEGVLGVYAEVARGA
jgi:glycosyltransferase involved in cell wall biosynthesis